MDLITHGHTQGPTTATYYTYTYVASREGVGERRGGALSVEHIVG